MKREHVDRPIELLVSMEVPSPAQVRFQVEAIQALFRRTLACWASDVLVLRRAGIHRLRWVGGAERTRWNRAA